MHIEIIDYVIPAVVGICVVGVVGFGMCSGLVGVVCIVVARLTLREAATN
jgi:hypothetical protein